MTKEMAETDAVMGKESLLGAEGLGEEAGPGRWRRSGEGIPDGTASVGEGPGATG